MRKERDIHNVLFHFLNESTDVVKILKTYQTDIEQEKNELAQQKGNDKKITILVNKSSDIQRKIDEITTSNLTMMDKIEAIDKEHYQAQYRAIKAELETLLASYYQAAKTVMQFSKASLSTLCKNSNWFSFGETSATHIHLEAITQKTNNILKNKFKHT